MHFEPRHHTRLSSAHWIVAAVVLLAAVTLLVTGCSSGDQASASEPPDPKATYRATHPTPTPIPVADACPSKGAVCAQAEQIATLVEQRSYEAIAAQAVGVGRTCSDPVPMILESRCPDGPTGSSVEGATLVVAAKPVQFPPLDEFRAQLVAVLGDAGPWRVAAIGCPGRAPEPDCSQAFTVVLGGGEQTPVIALTYAAAGGEHPGLIATSVLLPDAPALTGGAMDLIYLDRDVAFTGSYWFMPWQPAA